MSAAIREQITAMLGVEPVLINSALVSAQNRQRLYWCGKRNADGTYSKVEIEQPQDRGIMLRDILESGECWKEKAYCLRGSEGGRIADSHAVRTIATRGKESCDGVAEPVGVMENGKAYVLRANYAKAAPSQMVQGGEHYPAPWVAVCVASRGRYTGANGGVEQHFEVQESGKTNTLTSVQKDNLVAEPVRIGTIESNAKNADFDSQQYRVYSPNGKSVTLCGNGGGVGAKTGLYACPADGKTRPVYEVRDGQITIKGKQYPIKLRDGCYIIRKQTVRECMRLQTVPETYVFPVSNAQAYKMLGNGWTVDVIAHIMSHMDGITTEPLDVLSMYDGMACGHIALDKLGATVRHYWSTEIDKYAIQTATHNFPDIVELGDAFQVRVDDWRTI